MKRTGMWIAALLIDMILFISFFFAEPRIVTPLQQIYIMKQFFPELKCVGVLWNENVVDTNKLYPQLERASAQFGIKIVVSNVQQMKDVPTEFKNLKQKHNIQVLWVIGDDEILNGEVSRKYLIKQSIFSNLPLFAPSNLWVNEGAFISIIKEGNATKLFVNQQTAKVLSINIPEAYLENTIFYAAK